MLNKQINNKMTANKVYFTPKSQPEEKFNFYVTDKDISNYFFLYNDSIFVEVRCKGEQKTLFGVRVTKDFKDTQFIMTYEDEEVVIEENKLYYIEIENDYKFSIKNYNIPEGIEIKDVTAKSREKLDISVKNRETNKIINSIQETVYCRVSDNKTLINNTFFYKNHELFKQIYEFNQRRTIDNKDIFNRNAFEFGLKLEKIDLDITENDVIQVNWEKFNYKVNLKNNIEFKIIYNCKTQKPSIIYKELKH